MTLYYNDLRKSIQIDFKSKIKREEKMIRKIIKINEEKCNGCGACAAACHEGAIEMIDGKARLTREDYCDGLGDCLPACPMDAISFEEREAPAYDEAAVLAAKNKSTSETLPCGCPGTESRSIRREASACSPSAPTTASQLRQWPVQIKLVPAKAPYFENANLLVAADCCAYAYGNFHGEFIRNHIALIGCPKLDQADYAEKLTQIIANNNIKSVTVVRMEVPCCAGIENAVKRALQQSGKFIPWRIATISTDGRLLEN
jgi:ferredoxin